MTTATIETKAPFAAQTQSVPGRSSKMEPKPDHGEATYKGSGRLAGKRALVTGGDSGIGRAVAMLMDVSRQTIPRGSRRGFAAPHHEGVVSAP